MLLVCSTRIDLSTDDYGFETSWKLLLDTGDGPKEIYIGPPPKRRYGKRQRYIGMYCLPPGRYKYVIQDLFKDGMCCTFGEGKYAGYIGNEKIFSSPTGDENWEKRGHPFTIPSSDLPLDPKIQPGMTAREEEWLDSHNTRREQWHARYGKSYVPVKWSAALKEESQVWAEKLAADCELVHDPNNKLHGENIALNYGWGSWGEMRSTENILSRYVEGEADDDYPANGHLTQVLWRATEYIGCADAVHSYDGDGKCHAQVCRYSKP
ncbi:hypothetical protein ACHAXR_003725, partial [Thalassiosira sp. AJA248-18]